jgi:hypothetical protein
VGTTTRLSKADIEVSLKALTDVLDNLVKYPQCPISKDQAFAIHRTAYPDKLCSALEVLEKYGTCPVYSCLTAQTSLLYEGAEGPLAARVDMGRTAMKLLESFMVEKPYNFSIVKIRESRSWYLRVNDASLSAILGQELTESFVDWMKTCAIFSREYQEAHQVIHDIFGMINTAGQLKRMCPDLMRYLPTENRKAFESQKRASSIPFEWTPYPKAQVEAMLITMGKAYLFSGMAKPGQERFKWETVNDLNWAQYPDKILDDRPGS